MACNPWYARIIQPAVAYLAGDAAVHGRYRTAQKSRFPKVTALLPDVSLLTWLLSAVAVLLIAVACIRFERRRRRHARRVVEMPNSHYTAATVHAIETRHRWHDMDLDRIHEINREEVVRLLQHVDAAGVEALRPNERRFLDTMANLFGRDAHRGHGDASRGPRYLRPT
jgi:hypothetical protein